MAVRREERSTRRRPRIITRLVRRTTPGGPALPDAVTEELPDLAASVKATKAAPRHARPIR